jgi:hypothetical protein
VKSSAAEIGDNIFLSAEQVEFFANNKDTVSIVLVEFNHDKIHKTIRELTPDQLYDEFDLVPIKYRLRKRPK